MMREFFIYIMLRLYPSINDQFVRYMVLDKLNTGFDSVNEID